MLTEEQIRKNLEKVEERICAAAKRAGRDRSEITLIAVSKMNPPEAILAAYASGQKVFGENKVQELSMKQEVIKEDLDWHLIGHLQTNKVKYVVGNVSYIHSVDSFHLAQAISKEAEKKGLVVNILIEVNIGAEDTKYGVEPEKVKDLICEISTLRGVKVCGLMTVAPATDDPEGSRIYFRQMKELMVDIRNQNYDNIFMNVLSMGMSSDFEVAIEEGATHIRVGSSIFGERDYSAIH